MTALSTLRDLLCLLWQTLRLYGRHFLPLFLLGGLPGLLYQLLLHALGHAPPPRPDLESAQVLPPALRAFFLWNLPNLLLLQPLVSGALVAAVGQRHRQQPLQPLEALWTALRAWRGLLGANTLFWLPGAAAGGFAYWVFEQTRTSAGQLLGGLLMIALVGAFLYYWWVRWSFLSQVIIEEGCGPVAAFGRSSRLVAGRWWRVCGFSAALTGLPDLLENLLNYAGPWAVSVGQSLTAPLGALGMTLLYWEVRGRGEGVEVQAEIVLDRG
jgi:hypothetical protein